MMEKPFVGKTYSLYGIGSNSDDYYERLGLVADHCLTKTDCIEELLKEFSPFTKSAAEHLRELPLKKRWDRILQPPSNSIICTCWRSSCRIV